MRIPSGDDRFRFWFGDEFGVQDCYPFFNLLRYKRAHKNLLGSEIGAV